ncbi:MAG: DUF4202 domain-containing protein [Colwellia sp.]
MTLSKTHSSLLSSVLTAIDNINRADTNTTLLNGIAHAKELLYGHQMSECLTKHWPEASEVLQIAVRGQHIKRWHLKRNEFDEGKKGYFTWRIALGKFHAQLVEKIMLEQGYGADDAANTAIIIRKELLKQRKATSKVDSQIINDSQTLEDVACLVFLEHYFDEFAAKYTSKENGEEKIIRIVKLTWNKMSEQGHNIALTLELPDHLAKLVGKALQ